MPFLCLLLVLAAPRLFLVNAGDPFAAAQFLKDVLDAQAVKGEQNQYMVGTTSVDSQTIFRRLPSLPAMINSAHSSPIFFRIESGPPASNCAV